MIEVTNWDVMSLATARDSLFSPGSIKFNESLVNGSPDPGREIAMRLRIAVQAVILLSTDAI
jgi:hypothetical protein